jgi:phospho-N-acetylmuramoyl-pentapeptide-transferase
LEKYILIIVAIITFGIAALLGPVAIPILHRLKFGQEIREIGPSWHKKKSGTPTMGGFIFIISVIITTLIFIRDIKVLLVLLFSLAFGIIGFIDDFIKVILKRNLGLTEKQKSLLQILCALIFVFVSLGKGIVDTSISIPFVKDALTLPYYIYVPFVLFVIVGATNSVNLTDGVDGLATCVTIVVCAFFALVSYRMGRLDVAGFCIINSAALLGFLIFNIHPAKVFMGDTGSLYLGGVICFTAIVLKLPLILIIAGGIYVLETLSVIIQVTSFKLTGKRVFKMSPIHHHFEMCGWSEKKIVTVATLSTVVLCSISYFIIF